MILQALKEYYDRKADDSESGIAPEGFEKKEIPFLVIIKKDGSFVALEDTREQEGRRLVGKKFLLPRSKTRTGSKSYDTTFLLWDHIGYLFDYTKSNEQKDIEKSANQHRTWISSLENLPNDLKQDEGVSAVLAFYHGSGVADVRSDKKWHECIKIPSCNMTFRLATDPEPVPCRPAVKTFQSILISNDSSPAVTNETQKVNGRCLITGEFGTITRIHAYTPISKDSKSLVAFQKNSGYDSYGKQQCYNAPVSKTAEFAYTTALNTLLKSTQRLLVGDAVTVFWAARKTQLETLVSDFFNEPQKDDPDSGTRAVTALMQSITTGVFSATDKHNRFYVLGLSPSSARISVRFWKVDTVAKMAEHFARHFKDLKICRGPKEREHLSLFRLLVSTASLGKSENIPPNLAGETMRAILEGLPYPQTLLQATIMRIHAEQAKKDPKTGKPMQHVTYPRAALLKGCLNRLIRVNNPEHQEEIKVSLDKENRNIGYRLGRLFAALEKIQAESHPRINATIRDKFYGSASSSPVTVFGNLMRLKNHHLAKLESKGRRINLEQLIGEIMSGIKDFPPHLKLQDQGRFAIGYYHQMNDFYNRK
jgi:CRISPR-associated protein Csd1